MSRTLRLCFVCTEVFAHGGIQRFNRTLLAAADRLDVDCEVFSLNDTEASIREAKKPADGAGPPLSPKIRMQPFSRDKVRFVLELTRALRLRQYDYVVIGHVHFACLVMGALKLRLAAAPRTLLIAHGIEVWSGLRHARRWALKGVDRILCVSDYTRHMIQAQAPQLQDSRLAIFPNALSRSWLHHLDTSFTSTQPDRYPKRFLLSVARLNRFDRTKGVLTTLQSLTLLRDPGLHYVIAGRGDDLDFLRAEARRLHLEDRVHLPGGLADEQLADLYRRCAAFVLPSSQEGFGIVYLEAMLFGAPVIAAREKGAVDVVRDGETGLLVPYGDVPSLAKAIERILSDSPLRDSIRSRAHAMVVDDGMFTFNAFARRFAAELGVST